MLSRFKCEDKNSFKSTKILYGNDTDVSWCTIVKMSGDSFVNTIMYLNEETGKIQPVVHNWNYNQFKAEFELQYDSPMQYLSENDYEWMISDY